MKRAYETVIVFDGNLTDAALEKERQAVEDFLKTTAEFEKTEVWGKRKLAYLIKKKQMGYYCLFLYHGEEDAIKGLESRLKLNEAVLRYLTVRRNLNATRVALDPDTKAPRINEGELLEEDEEKGAA